ncbi:MAG: lysylphosphatidylglycerol synthase transmembrane domain-containing protein [Candidatus Krumholzibacteriia bacterium]
MPKKLLSLLLPLVGLAIFAWIVRGTGVERIVDTFRGVRFEKLLYFPLFTAYFVWIRGLRWHTIMRAAGIEYPLWRSAVVWAVGFFGASITPAKVGDALRAYYLSRDTGRNFGESFLTIFVDRLMDMVIVLISGVVTLLVFSYRYIHMSSLWLVVIMVAGVFGALYAVTRRNLVKTLVGPVFRALAPRKYHDELSLHFNSFYDSLRACARDRKRMAAAFVYALLFWTGVVFLAFSVTRILGIAVPLGYVLIMMPTVTLVELIPISVSGLGTREAAVIYFFSVVGIASAQAVGFSITYLLVGTYLTALVGFVAWLFKPARLSQGL